jgi:hypothetical protein
MGILGKILLFHGQVKPRMQKTITRRARQLVENNDFYSIKNQAC